MWQRIIRRCASPLRGRPKGRSSTLRAVVEEPKPKNPEGESGPRAGLAVVERAQGCGVYAERHYRDVVAGLLAKQDSEAKQCERLDQTENIRPDGEVIEHIG
jgi:hypothetical protein